MTTEDVLDYVFKKMRKQKDVKILTLIDENMRLNKLFELDKLPLCVDELYAHDQYEFIMFEQMLRLKQKRKQSIITSLGQSSIFTRRKVKNKVCSTFTILE
jgi:hypothetical protein